MIPASVRIFVCTDRRDMRRSFDALALAVKGRLELDPQSDALFVFASKRGRLLTNKNSSPESGSRPSPIFTKP